MTRKSALANVDSPPGGWLRTIRLAKGLSLQMVADRLEVSPQAVHQFEKSEVAGTISLRQLTLVAAAMGGGVRYSLVDVEGAASATVTPIAEPAAPVERSMFLENLESGRYD